MHTSAYAPRARSVSLTRKNMAALSELFIVNGHTFLCQQSHKTTESEDVYANEDMLKRTKTTDVVTLCVFCSCVGHELIRGEAAVCLKSGKRRELTNTKRRCWLVIAGCCSQETRWQLYPVHDFIYLYFLFPKNVISELKKYSKLDTWKWNIWSLENRC